MLSRYQSPVNFRSRKVPLRTRWITVTIVIFQTLNLCSYLLELDGLPFCQGRGNGWILRIANFLENYIGTDTGNVISEVGALRMSYWASQKATCLLGTLLMPLNVWRFSWNVAVTENVITEDGCIHFQWNNNVELLELKTLITDSIPRSPCMMLPSTIEVLDSTF